MNRCDLCQKARETKPNAETAVFTTATRTLASIDWEMRGIGWADRPLICEDCARRMSMAIRREATLIVLEQKAGL